MLLLVMKHVHHVHKHLLLLLQHLQYNLVVFSLLFLLKSKLLLIIKHSCLFLISSFLIRSLAAILPFVTLFSTVKISAFQSRYFCVLVQIVFHYFQSIFCFTVSPKVSNDFLCMPSAFAAFCSVFCFLLLFVTGVLVYFLIFFKSLYYICQSNVSFYLFWIDPTLPVLFPFLLFMCLF